jgi:hypothetical protein
MDLKDWLNVLAVFLSPLFAVQITVWLADRKGKRARRLSLFHTLMATRGSLGANGRLAPEHVKALNMLDIEFHGQKSAKPIIDTWKSYLDHLTNAAPTNDAQWEVWNSRRDDLMVSLLHAMSIVLGYKFDQTFIRRTIYAPQGYADIEADSFVMRKALVEMLHGRKALHITVAPPLEVATNTQPPLAQRSPTNPGPSADS